MAENPIGEIFGAAEPEESPEASGEAAGFGGVDPFVASLVMGMAGAGGERSGDPAVGRALSEYLRDLGRLARVQFEHLHEQRILNVSHLRVRLWRERLQLFLQAFLVLAALAAAALALSLLQGAFVSRRVVVEAFDTPATLAARGLTPKVVAGQLRDALARLQAATRAADTKLDVANAWDNDIKIEVPETGVSIGEIDRLLRSRFGHDLAIGGDVTQGLDGQLSLRVRGADMDAKTFTGAPQDLPKLVEQGAEYLYGAAEPFLFAVYLDQSGRAADAETFLAGAFPTAAPAVRAELANVWGNVAASQGRYGEAIERYRVAIHLDPRMWSAWANLVGALAETEGEEAAFRATGWMRVAAAAAPRSARPTPDNWQNSDPLTQDWAAWLADLDFDARRTGGAGTSDLIAGPLMADAAARMHNFAAADRDLLASDPKDPNTAAERLFIAGFRALDEGTPSRALPPLEALDALLRANPSLADSYVEATCTLGLAYGLTGQTAKAEAVFARRGRSVACYAFHADVLDRAGDWPGAQAAFARAVALAPDLPFAWQRWGLAMLRHGDPAGAIAKFAAAHQRGPHWAEPLKGWGDALLAEGRRSDAAAKFAEATPLAPRWAALRQARGR